MLKRRAIIKIQRREILICKVQDLTPSFKASMQTMFFSTRQDLIPVIRQVEAKRPLKYVRTGLLYSPKLTTYNSALDMPNLGIASNESAINGDNYLVLDRADDVSVQPSPQNAGGTRYAVDQGHNPRTICFLHGGQFADDIILYGRVATISNHEFSVSLYRLFYAAIRKHFTKLKAFYVGNEAKKLCDSGFRLTQAVQSPKEYDLSY